jgi:hypothetical protein
MTGLDGGNPEADKTSARFVSRSGETNPLFLVVGFGTLKTCRHKGLGFSEQYVSIGMGHAPAACVKLALQRIRQKPLQSVAAARNALQGEG